MRMVPIKAHANFDDIQGKQEDNKGRLCNEYLKFCKCKFLKNHMQCPEAHSIEEAQNYWAEQALLSKLYQVKQTLEKRISQL